MQVVSVSCCSGREKLCVSVGEPVRIVLESDGTQVRREELFQI